MMTINTAIDIIDTQQINTAKGPILSECKKLSYRLETGRQQCIFIAKLLSIAEMTYSYVYHLRNLRPMIRLICYPHSE